MGKIIFPRGSEWRRWDLHVHSLYSTLNNDFGANFEAYAKLLLTKAVNSKIAVIGITDYFCMRGYQELKELINDAPRLEALLGKEISDEARKILILLNVEFRGSELIVDKDAKSHRINFHVLFSDELEVKILDEHFFRELKFSTSAIPGAQDRKESLTLSNLEELGKRLKAEQKNFRGESNLYVGMMNAAISLKDVTEVLAGQLSRFKDRYLVAITDDLSKISWADQGHLVRKLYYQRAHMIFSSNLNTRAFALGEKHESVEDFEKEFMSRKPCIHGSDAHTYDKLFAPDDDRFCWIRADPSFQGLRQLLNEPKDRVYIGTEPKQLKRVRDNATKYLEEVSFQQLSAPDGAQSWFADVSVPLNSGLVAIIGRKGSGKSALADTLGLLSDCDTYKEFSFLSDKRFLFSKDHLGELFSATTKWRSGMVRTKKLSAGVDRNSPSLVKYIPQNYLEKICDQIEDRVDRQFYSELTDVIFSHVPNESRLNKESLNELIDYVAENKKTAISKLLVDLGKLNDSVAKKESLLRDEHRIGLIEKLRLKKAELESHETSIPQAAPSPSNDPETLASLELQRKATEASRLHVENLRAREALQAQRRAESEFQIAAGRRLQDGISEIERTVTAFYNENDESSDLLGVDLRKAVRLQVDISQILKLIGSATIHREQAIKGLDVNDKDSLPSLRIAAEKTFDQAVAGLDAPNRRFTQYKQAHAAWLLRKNQIIGAEDDPESIKGLEHALVNLNLLPAEITKLESERTKLVGDIWRRKNEVLKIYEQYYLPVREFMRRDNQVGLGFSAVISEHGFVDRLLSFLHRGKKGSFMGDGGRQRAVELISRADFSTEQSVIAFLANVIEHLTHDKRDSQGTTTRVEDQIVQSTTPALVYDYLYGLSYLEPRYELTWQDKQLEKLSPGERGSLLLIFYLHVDKRDVPLIIDQPEENLDNETIMEMLVPAIKSARERRQIILVTHNPNLAVVCDADQIVHCKINKSQNNVITYSSGSLEEPVITQGIVDVLEGTMPAFHLRDAKYSILDDE